ncbi:carboxymuconolactone decarboxylase family protein [Streptomyces sp. R-74717]
MSAGKALKDLVLPTATQELVALRVSKINGCAVCIDMRAKEAADAGETSVRLNLVAAWRRPRSSPRSTWWWRRLWCRCRPSSQYATPSACAGQPSGDDAQLGRFAVQHAPLGWEGRAYSRVQRAARSGAALFRQVSPGRRTRRRRTSPARSGRGPVP